MHWFQWEGRERDEGKYGRAWRMKTRNNWISMRFSIDILGYTPYRKGNIIQFKGIETIKEYKDLLVKRNNGCVAKNDRCNSILLLKLSRIRSYGLFRFKLKVFERSKAVRTVTVISNYAFPVRKGLICTASATKISHFCHYVRSCAICTSVCMCPRTHTQVRHWQYVHWPVWNVWICEKHAKFLGM
jgi:hypothetical protein